jgi:hypothetical protein
MTDTFNASANSIKINNGSQVVFDTAYRMPHILSSVSGTFDSATATITNSGGIYVNTITDHILDYKSYYQFSNSFVWAWFKVTVNPDNTDLAVQDSIFLTGSALLRYYIGAESCVGSYIITPMIYNGSIGFREEWQYANNTISKVPAGLFPTSTANTAGNLGLTFSYTLYYGRFI